MSPDFFDFIIVDECHRGSAKENSDWRKILEYFSSAIQLGLTATPKETEDTSNISYFGEPIYTYSLKQGIEDGFLAPYKVIRAIINIDEIGFDADTPHININNIPLEKKIYIQKDYDKNIIIDERTQRVAQYITEYLQQTNPYHKTIVFCVDTEHVGRMRNALTNKNTKYVKENSKYIMKITGDDAEGKAELENFIAEDEKYPVIVTTSQLLTTGVDCKTCHLIVIDKNIESMIEFKQIIGRGTRLQTNYGKYFFTILDFRNATRKFFEPDFDGEPLVIYEQQVDTTFSFNTDFIEKAQEQGIGAGSISKKELAEDYYQEPKNKAYIQGVEVIITKEQVQYIGNDGNLITQSITDFSKRNILGQYATLDVFIKYWNSDKKKEIIINELKEHGVLLEELQDYVNNPDIDVFDLICHIAYNKSPLTRAERVQNVRKRGYLDKYSGIAREVLDKLLDTYKNNGILEIESLKILANDPFRQLGSAHKIAENFGGRNEYIQAVQALQKELYTY